MYVCILESNGVPFYYGPIPSLEAAYEILNKKLESKIFSEGRVVGTFTSLY